jgi:uncharacterized membrane protein YedE/YeeE
MQGWLDEALESLGEPALAALGGLVIGIAFGACAQRSRFCLRAAVIDFWQGRLSDRVAVWLLAFASAVVATQALHLSGNFDTSSVRALSARGSLSGAIIGGAMFGAGMVLTRGCASRLLVLSANGNLRALLSGLVFAVTAQASLRGMASPLRDALANLWTVDSQQTLNALSLAGLEHHWGLAIGLVWLAAGIVFSWRNRIATRHWAGAIGVGLMVALAWGFTSALAAASFAPQPVKSLSFTGPSANLLMLALTPPSGKLDFDIGLVPGVFLGSFLAAAIGRELKLEGFRDGAGMRRYMTGAVLMGFGGMLAGGCAIGAGVSGAAVFSLIAWVTLFAMWAAAGLTARFVEP